MEFYVRVMPRWRLWFWWRDWDQWSYRFNKRNGFWLPRLRKQRLWKLQVGPLQFVFWHKR